LLALGEHRIEDRVVLQVGLRDGRLVVVLLNEVRQLLDDLPA